MAAIKAAARNHVSVEIEPDAADANGNDFGEAITRIALTPQPVVTGQQRIAASTSAGKEYRVYHLSDSGGDSRADPDDSWVDDAINAHNQALSI